MRKAIFLMLLAMVSDGAAAASSDTEALIKFMETYKNKYSSEVGNNELLQRTLVLDTTYPPHFIKMSGTYSDPKQELSFRGTALQATLYSFRLQERCVGTGSYVGVNAFGVRQNIKKETCIFFSVRTEPSNSFLSGMSNFSLSMTPSQYRTALVQGIRLRVELNIKPTASGEIVTFRESSNTPTIDDPIERLGRSYSTRAEYRSIGWILPGETEPSVIYPKSREQ